MCAYADDSSLNGPLTSLKDGLKHFVSLSQSIDFEIEIKLSKCFLIGKRFEELKYGEQSIRFVDYNIEAVRFWVPILAILCRLRVCSRII
ncbi:hypothetical protein GEMRC1_008371 [Eukaryota sp. GEM-RC1]